MIRLNRALSDVHVRILLRRIRDLNLGPCGVAVSGGEHVSLAGCLSLDAPVERGVRYSIVRAAGEQVVSIDWTGSALALTLCDGDRLDAPVARELAVELALDEHGRILAPALGARIDLGRIDALEIEHFLRRLVRGVCGV